MRIDALAIELRPRPMHEAADLGVRMVQAHRASVWRTFAPLYLVVVLLALSTIEIAPWLPGTLLFCLKPWLDRSLLFVMSRAVFGQPTRFADLWQARASVWWSRLGRTLTLSRLSPWRAYTLPVYQLEGQSGSASRERRNQLLNLQRGRAMAMQFVFGNVEMILVVGIFALTAWLAPDEFRGGLFDWLFKSSDKPSQSLVTFAAYALVVFALEPFFVAAGFAMYLNRRVELEAWDIEQEFRRAFGH